jgi:hypothetical protein
MHEVFAIQAAQHFFVSEFGISTNIVDPALQFSSSVALQVSPAAATEQSANQTRSRISLQTALPFP